jgi:cation diffusion facilitator family transporter
MQSSQEGKNKLKALKISAVAIFSVVLVEVTIGAAVNSLAIISDGLHAMLDGLTAVMLFFAIRASLKPPDEEHTYGHEKFETIGGLIGGIVLIAVAILIFYESAIRLVSDIRPSGGSIEYAGFIAIAYAFSIASLRVTVFKKFEHTESQSRKAGLYDAISDLSSTIIAFAGFGLAILGIAYADAIASIFLGIMLTYLSIKLAKSSVMELSDSASRDIIEKAQKAIISCEGVVRIVTLKARKVSSKIYVEACVQVPNAMSLEDSHALASKIEACLKDALGNVESTIHVEPVDKEQAINERVKKLASVEGVKEVHEISTNYVKGKLYITLHAHVNPEMSVEDAHKIAEEVERKIRGEIKPLENVTVHIEPAGTAIPAVQVSEDQVKKAVADIAKVISENLEVKKVVTYAADGVRYINIDCCFTKQIKIKEAHKLASWIEKETKDKFAGAEVTVHMEPKECSP